MLIQLLNLRKSLVILLFAALCVSNFDALSQETTIWLVRHAEKSTDNPADKDPGLNTAGLQRAEALAQVLKQQNISTIYVTAYKRTAATAAPLATALKLTPITYQAADAATIAAEVLKTGNGKSALIVGHSNTLIPILKALGSTLPFDTMDDNDYDMLFKVVTGKSGQAKLNITRYGITHHKTEL